MGGSAVGGDDSGYAYRVCKRVRHGTRGNRIGSGECCGGGRRGADNYQDSWRGQQGHG